MNHPISLGLDFGTESVRAILVDALGKQWSITESRYTHGQITGTLPDCDEALPPRYALQCPSDWIESAASATQAALSQAGVDASGVVGIGVDFTSCTMLPTTIDGTPLCELETFKNVPLAWPKLWKHHGCWHRPNT